MSHVASVKKLLSDDLKGLITQITGFKEGTQEFKNCENSSWSTIIDRYHPSVNEHKAKATLYDFVHKFKVHGFPQKAQNLTMLIDAYTKLSYFQEHGGSEVKWGLIDFLTKLSHKPTDCSEDDPPLDLSKKAVEEEESFDWGAYLKEGCEKFRLPSEDGDSLSDWSDEEADEEAVEEAPAKKPFILSDVPSKRHLFTPPLLPPHDLEIEAQERAEKANYWIKTITQGLWWNDETFREIPKNRHPEANFCFHWEKATKTSCDTRVLSEYKVLRELIYVLARPTECYFIKEVSPDSFKVTPKTSISSLSPITFAMTIEENVCKYLPRIRRLQSFCSEMNFGEVSSRVPATYRAYSAAIQKILNKYYIALLQFEEKVEAQDSIITMSHLFIEMYPFINQICFLNDLHEEAIPQNWRERDLRTNAFGLLCALYDELKYPSKWKYGDTTWPSQNMLILILESLYPFFKFLAAYMSGYPHSFMDDEFFLSRSGEILVAFKHVDSREFWEPVLRSASAAITSCSFLMELENPTNFFNSAYPSDILFVKVVETVSEMLYFEPLNLINTEAKKDCIDYNDLSQKWPGLFDKGIWRKVFQDAFTPSSLNLPEPTICDRLSEKMSDSDLTSCTVSIILTSAVTNVIQEYMEPKGFASEILLGRLKLLDHLNALHSALQVTSVFSTVLIIEFLKCNNWKKIMWVSGFENCLVDLLPHEYILNFRLVIDKQSLMESDVSLFGISDYIQLSYQTNNTILTLISEAIVEGYAQIFCFLLKTRITLGVVNRLFLERIEENENNTTRIRRLCSLRLWLLHAMNSINLYFSSYNNVEFQSKMKELCLTERNLHSILRAHEDFVENWKHHCFVSIEHPCHNNILELISLSAKLVLYYNMEQKELLADYHLDDFEQAYMDCMRSFASSLKLFDDRLLDRNDTFSFLYDEVINNLPVQADSFLS